jgi:peptide/nickel transport system substrate-binding protein
MDRRTLVRTAPVLLAAVLAACAVVGTVERPVAGGRYREAVVGQPLSLNPLLDPLDPIVRDVSRLLFAGLVRVSDGGEIQGDLAERWTTDETGTTYTFSLRGGSLWHDGRPVTAADVVSTVGIVQAPDYPGPRELSNLWRHVTVEALDPRTVRMRLEAPYASFIEACTLPLLPAHQFQPAGAGALRDNPSSYQPVGAGPFKLLEMNPAGMTLARHSGYTPAPPYLQELELAFFPDREAAASALMSGTVDGFAGASSIAGPPSRSAGAAINASQMPLLGRQIILFMNHRNPVVADGRVRLAMAAALDRGSIAAGAGGSVVPVYGPIPAYSWAYAPLVESEPDPGGARSLLDGAGWQGGSTRAQGARTLRLQMLVPVDPQLIGIAEAVQAQLKAVGIQVDLQPTETLDLYRERLSSRMFDLALLNVGLGTLDPDPFAFWDSSQAADGFNIASYQRPEADNLLRLARIDGDPSRRREALSRFQQLWVADVPSIVLASPVMTYTVSNDLHGVRLGVIPEPGARFQHISEWYVKTERVPALFG